ncbi:MAG: acyl--CoA ligase [SAR324 cluster bacterium]|nr:acyl--CoA ligase [SAR324 cluster bacterium]
MLTLGQCFEKTVRQYPHQGLSFPDFFISWQNLNDSALQLSQGLMRSGISSGSIVAICLPNGLELALLHLAVIHSGAIALPLNPRFTARELNYILQDSEATMLFTDGFFQQSHAEPLKKLPSLKKWIDLQAHPAEYANLFLSGESAPTPAENADQIAYICYTSGTTGQPKGACLTHGNIVSNLQSLFQNWEITPNDNLLLSLPMFHVHGLMLGLLGCFIRGHSAHIMTAFDVDVVLDLIIRQRITLFMGVPTMYARFAQSSRLEELRHSAMRLFTSGSAALSQALFDQFHARTGYRIVERYGLTETMINTTNPYQGEQRPGTVGLPLEGIQLRLMDATGKECATGQIGEIEIKGPNVFLGYYRREDATKACFHEGWFRTGDSGCYDASGYLRIVGRIKELIISGGFNIYPGEIEHVIESLEGISECAVVGIPNEEWGEVVCAVMVKKGSVPVDDTLVKSFCQKNLAAYKIPKKYLFTDSLPRNAMGKIQKHLISQALNSGQH